MKGILIWFATLGVVSGAPMLRLSNSAVTAQVAVGATAPGQTLQAGNAGDGALSLAASVAPGASWLTVSIGASQPCPAYFDGLCNAIQFTFNSANLVAGTHTAAVTVSDPNAIDSPQVVIVTLQVGFSIDRYMAPGAAAQVPLPFSCVSGFCTPTVSTTDGGGWLSVVVSGELTFFDYQSIQLAPAANMQPGIYTGEVAFSGAALTDVPVTMRLTTLPVGVPSANQISLRLAQNGPAITYPFLPYISLSNSGMGTLQVTGVSGLGTGVSAYDYQGLAIVTVDPGSLAPGIYSDGLVTIQCNGANCPVQVPVTLEVDPQGPPIVNYQGALDNAGFSPTGSPGDVMIVKGSQLSLEPPQAASGAPLPTTLGGASVLVNGVATPLYYSSFGQIAFQARADTYLGTALVEVVRDGQFGNTVSVNMAPYAPGIVTVTDASYNVVDANHPVKTGSTLIFWVLGLGATNPPVPDGTAAPTNPLAVVTVAVTIKATNEAGQTYALNPSFAGLSPGSVGLYQVIANAPASSGNYSVSVLLPGGFVSKSPVSIAVE